MHFSLKSCCQWWEKQTGKRTLPSWSSKAPTFLIIITSISSWREGENNPQKHTAKKKILPICFMHRRRRWRWRMWPYNPPSFLFLFFSPRFSFSVSLFVSSSSLSGFVVERLVSSIQRKVSEYISTNEMGFFCDNNTHTHTHTRRKGRRINLPTLFESLKCSLLLPTSLVPTYVPSYLPT